MMIDDNQLVQKAACSAFAALEEEAGPELAPYLELVLRKFLISFQKYAKSNILVLYDAVETLADAVGSALQSPTYVEILMPSLLERWSKLKDDNDELILLLQVRFQLHEYSAIIHIPPAVSCFRHDRDGTSSPPVCNSHIRPVPRHRAHLPASVRNMPAGPRDGPA